MSMDPHASIRWAAAAYRTDPRIDETAVARLLADAGMVGGERAAVMLPLALGRQLIEPHEVAVSPTAAVRNPDGTVTELLLAEDPWFAAATIFAATEATRADFETAGLRSAEVGALDQALKAEGGHIRGGSFAPPLIHFGAPVPSRHVAPPPDVQAAVEHLAAAHGSHLPLQARIFPGRLTEQQVVLQLDVTAPVGNSGRQVVESFAGIGPTIGAATSDTLATLSSGSLHALLAALDNRSIGTDQVDWERWGPFDACLGPMVQKWSPPGDVGFRGFLDAARDRFLASGPALEPHWIRSFVFVQDGRITGFEMLLDNEPWPEGAQLIQSRPWPAAPGAYSVRHFLVLLPST